MQANKHLLGPMLGGWKMEKGWGWAVCEKMKHQRASQVVNEMKTWLGDGLKPFFNKVFKDQADLSDPAVDVDVAASVLKEGCTLDFAKMVTRFSFCRKYGEVPHVPHLGYKLDMTWVGLSPLLCDLLSAVKTELPADLDEQEVHFARLRIRFEEFSEAVAACSADGVDSIPRTHERLNTIVEKLGVCLNTIRRSALTQRIARLAKCVATTRDISNQAKLVDFKNLVTKDDVLLKEIENALLVSDLFDEDGLATKFMFALWETEAARDAVVKLSTEIGDVCHCFQADMARLKSEFIAITSGQVLGRPLEADEKREALVQCLFDGALEESDIQLIPPTLHGFLKAVDPNIQDLKKPEASLDVLMEG